MAPLVILLLLSFTASATLASTPSVIYGDTAAHYTTTESTDVPNIFQDSDGSVSLHRDDVQVNLIVNQLAILKLLNHTSSAPGGGVESVVEEVRLLREDMQTTLRQQQTALQLQLAPLISASQPDAVSRVREECVASVQEDVNTVKDNQATLREELDRVKEELATLKREAEEGGSGDGGEVEAGEVSRIRSDLAALNTTIIKHVSESETKLEEVSASVRSEVSTLREGQVTLQASLTNLTNLYLDTPNLTCTHSCSGEGVQVSSNCTLLDCHEGCLRPHQDAEAFSWRSSRLDGECVHLVETSMTWDAARAQCQALGGDLFVAGDFQEAIILVFNAGYDTWVGVKERAWLDGRAVAEEEWAPGQPDDVRDACGFIRPSSKALRDAPCTSAGSFLCQSGVSY